MTAECSGEKISVPVIALETPIETPMEISVEWNEKWFGENTAFIYNHNLARIACILSEVSYVDTEEDPRLTILKKVYRKFGVKDDLMEFHYDIDYSLEGYGYNQAAFSFASKDIYGKNGKSNLIFVTIRGTPEVAEEWISNINVGDSSKNEQKIHEGFFYTESQVQKSLIDYVEKNNINPANAYFLITGHSRGAAVANLLGALLADTGFCKAENLYVYTFASPNVSCDEKVSDPKYNFIWNIVNPEDLVPAVPFRRDEWKYKKFGQTKVFCSYWNVDHEVFDDEYLSGINKTFNTLMKRDYCPFRTGTYIPSIVTQLVTGLCPDVKSYYHSPLKLRNKFEDAFHKIFPEEKPQIEKAPNAVFALIARALNEQTNGFLDYSTVAFMDMHCCTTYLSWLLAFDEDRAFSETGSSRIIIKGTYDCAVFDKDGNVCARVLDSIVQLTSLRTPVVAFSYSGGTVIGFPSSDDYKIVVYKDSLLPTFVSARIEHYDAQGYLTESFEREYLTPRKNSVCVIEAGSTTLFQTRIEHQKVKGEEARTYIRNGGIVQREVFRIQPELTFSSDWNVEGGVRFGSRVIHCALLTGHQVTDLGKAFELSTGLGHEVTLIDKYMLDFELYGKFLFALDDSYPNSERFNFIPSARVSLCLKPFRRFEIFVSGVFDFDINDFNDFAFKSEVRNKNFGLWNVSDKVKIVPSVRFGFRL